MKQHILKQYLLKSYLIKIAIILLMISILSCKKFIDVSPASNLILQDAVFSNDQTATSAISSLYNRMVAQNLSLTGGGMSIYPGLSSDELFNTSNSVSYDPFYSNNIPSNNSIISISFWSNAYRSIYQANAIIAGIDGSGSIDPSIKKQLLGEAKFIRSFYFFYLINLFGDVPLTTTTDYRINASMSRIPINQIYAQIINDLKEAQSLLSETYYSNFRVRANKWAAAALLARVYLYTGDWVNAELEASLVISSPLYSLQSDLTKTFLNTSSEAIWQLMRETANTYEGTLFNPSSTTVIPPFALTSSLLGKFEAGDLRKSNWIHSNAVNSLEYFYPYKYKVRSGSIVTEYSIVLRLSEQYLIRAEARTQLDKNIDAISDLNAIRSRSRAAITAVVPDPLPDLPVTLVKTEILSAIAKERQTELFAEWGHRWFDLKRTNKIDKILTTRKTGWLTFKSLYPIPYDEVQTNVSLIQNPGYEN